MSEVAALFDYDALRRETEASMYVAEVTAPTLVLGGSQRVEVLDDATLGAIALRRRRGGGGLVLLRPGDLWIDWWIPAGDHRWLEDVRASAVLAGEWWAAALRAERLGDVVVHEGALEGAPEHRVVCFAGRGPGEVFVNGRKAVGLTQWRVREGIYLSSVLPAGPTDDVIDFLVDVPAGLSGVLDHHSLAALVLLEPARVVRQLKGQGGPWRIRPTSVPN